MRKQNVRVAKKNLSTDEIDTLNRLVVIFLEQTELRVKQKQQLTLDYWCQNVDGLLEFSDYLVRQGSGSRSAEQAKAIAHQRYNLFDAQRRQADALEACAEDLRMLENVRRAVREFFR